MLQRAQEELLWGFLVSLENFNIATILILLKLGFIASYIHSTSKAGQLTAYPAHASDVAYAGEGVVRGHC